MSKSRARVAERILALILAVVLTVGLLPAVAFASPSDEADAYTVTITDGKTAVDASIDYSIIVNDEPAASGTVSTANGVATIDEMADYAEAIASEDDTVVFKYSIAVENYKPVEDSVTVNSAVDNVDVTLTAIEKCTVTVVKTGEGKVTLNDEEVESITVEKGTSVALDVAATGDNSYATVTVGDSTLAKQAKSFSKDIVAESNITVKVDFEELYSVEVSGGEGFTATVNGKAADNVLLADNSEVNLKVSADNGYQIDSVCVDGTQVELSDGEYRTRINGADMSIVVNAVKVWTVTFTYDEENGSVESDPACVAGKIEIVNGKTFSFTATPNTNYRVSEVAINSDTPETFDENDKEYKSAKLTADKDYVITVSFALNNVEVSAAVETGNGVATAENGGKVAYGGDAKVCLEANSGYEIDTIVINGVSYEEVSGCELEASDVGNEYTLTIKNVTEKTDVQVSYKASEPIALDNVKFNSEDALRIISESNTYVFGTDAKAVFTPDGEKYKAIFVSDKHDLGQLKTSADRRVNSVTIDSDESVQLIALNNRSKKSGWNVVSGVDEKNPINIVYDLKAPVLSAVTDLNKFFGNADIKDGVINVVIKATDEADAGKNNCTGLKEVVYWIGNDKDNAKTVVVNDTDAYVAGSDSQEITVAVPAEAVEGDVLINAVAYDLAGNASDVTTFTVKVSTTAPSIKDASVDKENKNGTAYAEKGFYTSATLNFTVVDGAAFNENGIVVKLNGNEVEAVWGEANGNTHTASVALPDGKYENWSVEYKNLANNSAETVSKADSFTVDSVAPEGEIASKEILDFGTIIIKIFTLGFYQGRTEFYEENVVDNTNVTASYYLGEDNLTEEKLGTVTFGSEHIVMEPNPPKSATVYIKLVDQAGNTTYLTTGNIIVTSGEGTVTLEPTTEPNENGFYNHDIVFDVVAEDSASEDTPYAGIQSIDYEVIVGEETMASANVRTFEQSMSRRVRTANESFILKAEDFNYDNITVRVTVTDNSGNTYSAQIDGINICTVAPTLTVDFEQPANKYDNDSRLYFKDETVNATVTITDRESAFDEAAASAALLASGLTDQEEITWTNDGDTHTADVSFSNEGSFTWDINYTNLAGLNGKHTELFAIDRTNPTGETWIDDSHKWDKLIEVLTFGIAKRDTTVTVSATAEDENSGVKIIEYYVTDDTTALTAAELDSKEFKEYKNELSFNKDERFTVYFKITDLSGNYSYISTNGVVIDNTAPEISYTSDAPTLNDIYGINDKDGKEADTIVIVPTVEDKNISSGIKSVSYWVECDGQETQNGTLYENTVADPQYSELESAPELPAIEVDKQKNNSCDVTVHIKAVDYAGNETPKDIPLDIDVTAPAIELSFDNNTVYNESYFDAARTATIVYTERAAHFDQEAAEKGIVITAKDFNGGDVVTPAINWGNDGDTHTATVVFDKDANYTLSISYADKAGNVNSEIVVEDSVAPYEFTVDTNPATASVTATAKTSEDNGQAKTWTEKDDIANDITYEFTSTIGFDIAAEAADATAGVKSIEYYKQVVNASGESVTGATSLTNTELDAVTDWAEYTEAFEIKGDQQCTVYFKITDYANHVTYIRTNGLTVDSTAPEEETLAPVIDAEVQPAPANGIYNGDVTVDVTVADPINGDAYSGLKLVTYKVLNMGEKSQEGTLYSFGSTAPRQSELKQSFSEQITVDADKNNSNDVEVVIYAVDNAGNTSERSIELKIDTTAPVIDISYNNNNADSGTFFKANRTATVVVTERNFDASDVITSITDTDGAAPAISSFTKTKEGTGNGDDTQWTATIVYANDGDYTFDIAYTDEAENKCSEINYADGTVAPEKFTIDKTMPTVLVSYDNNNALNSNYYSAARTATVTITEHNFDASRVNIMLSATDDGANTTMPTVSQWTTNGDKHTATIRYGADAKYSFDIAIKDLAGNESADFAEQQFYVDTTAPELDITGVLDNSANSGDIIPVVTYSDTNYNAADVTITLTGANRGNVELRGSYTDTHNGRVFTFANFEKIKSVDDIYTLTATLTDFAGNTTSKTITFSANRFGSTYELGDETKEVVGTYIQKPIDVVIYETNVNALSNIKVTLFKNNKAIVLKEGTDYTLSLNGGGGSWYRYTYTLSKDNFADDGVYRIVIHSEDAAGNIAENTLDTKAFEIGFGVDNTDPNIIVTNLEDGETYAEESKTVVISANDNLSFVSMVVYLDGEEVMKWNAEEISKIVSENGEFEFVVPGDSNRSHDIKIVCTDAAGNETVAEVNDFYVTTNLFVRFFNNKPLFFGTLLGLLFIIFFIILFKRKKDEDEEEEQTQAAK